MRCNLFPVDGQFYADQEIRLDTDKCTRKFPIGIGRIDFDRGIRDEICLPRRRISHLVSPTVQHKLLEMEEYIHARSRPGEKTAP